MKLTNLFIKTLYDHRLSTLFWFIGLFLTVIMYVSMFPSIAQTDEFAQAMASMPEAFQSLFGDLSLISTPEGYLQTELFSLMLPLVFVIAGIVLSGSILHKEESTGTLELLLSRPMSRTRIVLEKVAAMLVLLLIIALGAVAGLLVGMGMVEFPMSIVNFASAVATSYALGLVFSLLSLCLSALKPNRGVAVGVPAALLVMSFIVTSFADSVELLEKIKNLSPFEYHQTMTILHGGMEWLDLLILLSMGAALLAISIISFNRRDVGV